MSGLDLFSIISLFFFPILFSFFVKYVHFLSLSFFCYLTPNSEEANLLIKMIFEEPLVSSFVIYIFLQIFEYFAFLHKKSLSQQISIS
jgi:hypothetical protein